MLQLLHNNAETETKKLIQEKKMANHMVSGTTNCFILAPFGIIIGVDSRITVKERSEWGGGEHIMFWIKDSFKKFHVVVKADDNFPSVCVTVCGSVRRIKWLIRFIRRKVRRGIRDIVVLKEVIETRLSNYPPPHPNFGCSIYLAGLDQFSFSYRVYYLSDSRTPTIFISENNITAGAIGSGSEFALATLSGSLSAVDCFESAKTLVVKALLDATINDVCTGGDLNVFLVKGYNHEARLPRYIAPKTLYDSHCVQTLIELDSSCSCMGQVYKGWQMFIVNLPPGVARHLFTEVAERGFICGDGIRLVVLKNRNGTFYQFMVARADAGNGLLAGIRGGMILS